jgi:tetratricopeptide (TPR) repeat protein
LTNSENKDHHAPEGGGITPPGKVVLAEISIDPGILKLKPLSKRAFYRAVINSLTKDKPPPDASNLRHVRGYLDAFDILCEVEDRDKAKKILLTSLNTPTNDDLGTQLGVWGYHEEQAQRYRKLYKKLDGQTDALCLKGLGTADHFRNRFESAHHYYNDAITLFEQHREYAQAAWLRHSLGLMEADQGEYQNARAIYKKALEQFRKLEIYIGVASVLQDLARAEADLGKTEAAREHFKESLNIHTHLLNMEDKKGCAWAYHNFGRFLEAQGEYRKAREYTERAFDLFREMEYGLGISWSFYYLSIHELNRGSTLRACAYVKKALEVFHEQENRRGVAWACHILGRIAFKKENYELARAYYQEQLRSYTYVRNKSDIVSGLEGLACLAAALGNPARGARLFAAAKALRKRIKYPLLRSDRVPRSERVDYENGVTFVHTQMEEEALAAAWDLGQAMSIEQAIAEALDESG